MKYQLLVLFCLALVVVGQGKVLNAKKNEVQDPMVKLSLVYESLCPYCRNFITKQLGPNFEKFQKYLDIHLNPYGNAKTLGTGADGQYEFKCQHGVEECIGSIIEGCLIQKMKKSAENKSPVPTLACMEQSDDLYHIEVLEACMTMNDVTSPSVDEVKTCANGPEGNQMFKMYGNDVASLDPPHKFVPWIMFNDKWNENLQNEAEANLPATLCRHFLSGVPECEHH